MIKLSTFALMKPRALVLSLLAMGSLSAHAELTITPFFDTTITSDPNALLIEAGINQAISRIEADISTTITVKIDFKTMTSGLGQSSTYYNTLSYSKYRADLVSHATSANDATALSFLPSTSTNPVNGTSTMDITTALLRALGENALGNTGTNPDSTISLNTSIMNLSRTGAQNSSFYDLQAVAAHEIDEVLDVGGPASNLPTSTSTTGDIGVMDLYRYSANGVRSYTSSGSATSYFSINGGATDLVDFNQINGADYADWKTGSSPQVQDAFGTPGAQIDIGTNELTALDVVGYTLNVVPEPQNVALVLAGLLAIGARLRFRARA